MEILIDNQVYENQNFGGISRYFNELQDGIKSIQRMELYEQKVSVKTEFFKKLFYRTMPFGIKQKSTSSYKNEFYRSQLKKREYDVFHPTYYDNYFLETLEKPFVITVHDMIHEKYPEYFGSRPDSINKRRLCIKASKIIAISETTKNDIIEIFGISENKIEVIYHASNFRCIKALKPKLDFQRKEYLLFTGNRNTYKNFLTFLVAVEPLLKGKPDLILICTGPKFNRAEEKWIRDLQLEKCIFQYYCEKDEELAYLYRNAVCFVFPSLYEGFGFPLLEAFACGCPVVSSSGGALSEIAGDAAIYFEPKNLKSMRNAMYEVIYNESIRSELVRAGKQRISEFSWDKCRKETYSLYEKTIAG